MPPIESENNQSNVGGDAGFERGNVNGSAESDPWADARSEAFAKPSSSSDNSQSSPAGGDSKGGSVNGSLENQAQENKDGIPNQPNQQELPEDFNTKTTQQGKDLDQNGMQGIALPEDSNINTMQQGKDLEQKGMEGVPLPEDSNLNTMQDAKDLQKDQGALPKENQNGSVSLSDKTAEKPMEHGYPATQAEPLGVIRGFSKGQDLGKPADQPAESKEHISETKGNREEIEQGLGKSKGTSLEDLKARFGNALTKPVEHLNLNKSH